MPSTSKRVPANKYLFVKIITICN